MGPITTSILLGFTAALANGLGGAVIVQKDWERRYLRYFVALGAGFMLGTAFLEMLPESIAIGGPQGALLMLVGYFLVHFFEHTVTGHFHFGEETHAEEFVERRRGYSVLFGLVIHTFFDGIAIASGFLISGWLGWIIFLAVILHKVPGGLYRFFDHAGQRTKQSCGVGGVGDFGAGDDRRRADHDHSSPARLPQDCRSPRALLFMWRHPTSSLK